MQSVMGIFTAKPSEHNLSNIGFIISIDILASTLLWLALWIGFQGRTLQR